MLLILQLPWAFWSENIVFLYLHLYLVIWVLYVIIFFQKKFEPIYCSLISLPLYYFFYYLKWHILISSLVFIREEFLRSKIYVCVKLYASCVNVSLRVKMFYVRTKILDALRGVKSKMCSVYHIYSGRADLRFKLRCFFVVFFVVFLKK